MYTIANIRFWHFQKGVFNVILSILKIQLFKDKFEYKPKAYEDIKVLQTNTDYA